MILYDYIAKAKANHLWGSLCAISNWAMYKEMQYRIYKAVLETEPERKYGYKVRVASYVCENGILNGGGVFAICYRPRHRETSNPRDGDTHYQLRQDRAIELHMIPPNQNRFRLVLGVVILLLIALIRFICNA